MSGTTRRSDPTPARTRRVLATAAAALVPLACGHSIPDTTSPDVRPSPSRGGSLAGTEWILTEFRGEPPLGGAEITLAFDDSTAGGYAGCNHYGGAPVVTAATVRLDALVSTARACEDARFMEQEADYLAFLGETSVWEIKGNVLTLRSESGWPSEGDTLTLHTGLAGTLIFRAASER
jgi:heat shock protein HslJ